MKFIDGEPMKTGHEQVGRIVVDFLRRAQLLHYPSFMTAIRAHRHCLDMVMRE